MNNINSLIIKTGQLKNVDQMAVEVSGFTIKRDNGCYRAKESAWHNACPLRQAGIKSQTTGKEPGARTGIGPGSHYSWLQGFPRGN